MTVFSLVFALLLPAQAPAPSPAADEAVAKARSPLEDAFALVEEAPDKAANLKKAIALYDQVLQDPLLSTEDRAFALVDLSRAWLRLGDLKQKTAEKIAAYEKGKAAGERARALSPDDANAVFWATANLASIAKARGVMNSLFMAKETKAGLEEALRLDPRHAYARDTLAKVYHLLPGLAGGNDRKAEALWKENLEQHPHFTPSMVELGRFYPDKGRIDEARALFERCIAEKRAQPRNDWLKWNRDDARRELSTLEGK